MIYLLLFKGELVSGVIGKTRLCYDVWGDTVNTGKSECLFHYY